MQLIESTPFGVRSAYRKLTSSEKSPTIHLFPMVHIGDEAFYAEVHTRASQMDIVLTEGVKGQVPKAITLSYRLVEKNSKFGLVTQPSFPESETGPVIVNIDVSHKKFSQKWQKTKWITRFGLPALAPFYGLKFAVFGSREQLAKHLGREFLECRADILSEDEMFNGAKDVILHWRDENLVKEFDKLLDQYAGKHIDIAIIYGAAHMKAVIKFLIDEKEYRIVESEWLDLIKL